MTLRRRLGGLIPREDRSAPRDDRSAPPGAATGFEPASRKAGGTKGRMLRAKPPNVIGRGPLLGSPGFGVVIVCIARDEADYLEEWLAYHFALGVDHVVIYDNRSTDGTATLLERFINHGLVTRIDWPLGGGQLAAYNHSLRVFGGSARWLAYFDVDEFLVPLLDDDIPAFLARFPDAADVRVPRVELGYSGHRTPPAGLTLDAYTQVANVLDLDPDLPPRVKSIVQPRAVSAIDIHLAFPADEPLPGAPTATAEAAVRGVAQLNHYYTRSLAEFEAKRSRGSATGRIDRPAVPFDLPTLATDTAARRFSARTEAELARLRSLDPEPYTYGSQLALDYFPRPNDLGRFAEFAIANTAAGLPEPSRIAAARVRNLHPGVGLVADVSDTGFAPVRDGLSASVHTAALVAHMRGRIVTDLSRAGAGESIATSRGGLEIPAAGPASLSLPDGRAELLLALPRDEVMRCFHLGFLLAADAPVRLEAMVEGPDEEPRGTPAQRVVIDLPASPCLAGVVEVAPRPGHPTHLRLRFSGDVEGITLHDLFVIATG